jgi:hypothetical protein
MPDLDLQALPPELQAALERVWPGCPEAQRRALLGPWAESVWRTVWPDYLWPWQPAMRWWRPGEARQWRESFERYFASTRRNILQASGPRLFDPAEPFFDTPWTRPLVALRSPVPGVFSNAEFWAMTMQLFDGDADAAASYAQESARQLQALKVTSRAKRDAWWVQELIVLQAAATGSVGAL